jgi:CelD/BcsL family acetyltransferase involved in cellulose biosynthesis
MGLRVESVDTIGALNALAPAWRELFSRAGATLPFHTFEWVDSWWTHLREDLVAVRDSLRVRAIWDGDRLVAVAPLVLTERPGVGPVRARYLHFVGADPNMTELRGMLVEPEYARVAYRALGEALRREGGWDWIRWSGLIRGDADAVERHLTVDLPPISDFVLALAPTWDELRARLKPNIKESLRKCYNSLKRDGKVPTLRVARTPDEIADAVERFLALHRARAKADANVRHRDVFSAPVSRRFLLSVCDRLAHAGVSRAFELEVDGKIVATRLGFQFPGALYLYFSGYDPEYGKYSVMTTVVAEAIRYAIGEKLNWVNLSTGSDVSKTRWGPEEIVYREGIQLAPARRAQLAYATLQRAAQMRESPRWGSLAARFLVRRQGQ